MVVWFDKASVTTIVAVLLSGSGPLSRIVQPDLASAGLENQPGGARASIRYCVAGIAGIEFPEFQLVFSRFENSQAQSFALSGHFRHV
ncbi:hypothetical protein [Sphingomonas gilva]|uniref:hypothetical protein n=1 Tax=Sphingomonas gilva TaxID=2305907 RepID=UPI001CA3D0A5|nr:hypothetical protein [Sphingomonas gilva]